MMWLVWAGACLLAGTLGSLATAPAIPVWYAALSKPPWTPPSWVFGPAWTVLYLMMGTAAWLVWKEHGWRGARTALTVFCVQLLINAAWSPLFFGLRSPLLGLLDILLLWPAILATALLFRPLSAPAAWLLAPYLLWVSYAAALNLAIAWMNRS